MLFIGRKGEHLSLYSIPLSRLGILSLDLVLFKLAAHLSSLNFIATIILQ